ncbi:MAG: COX15/CtaA family protein [Planctomycetes bacterium]|nr:COX15/CtaA family protein [Planctomycetota bacterium]MCB9884252.1 COX15/CtaA family protein [Planctomycetota bacterium]
MSSSALPLPARQGQHGPFRLGVTILVMATTTILWGAMTTSTGSGLAFTDWPTSDQQFMPERSLTTVPGFLEHFHRLLAGTTGLLALALALWLHFGRLGSRGARGLAWFGGTLLLVQGLVGGLHVLEGLPAATAVTHGTLAQLTMASFAWLTYLLSARHANTPVAAGVPTGSGRKLALAAIVILVLQTVVGATARHTNSSHALWTHVGNAFVVFVVVSIATAFAVGKIGQSPGIRGIARTMVMALIVQIGLGFVALVIRNSAGKTPENVANLGTAALISVHVLLGALLTVLAATLAAHVFRATRAPDVA